MSRAHIAKALSLIVMVGGSMVMVGWFLDIPQLKSILPIWVTMKFSTALCFFLSALILHALAGSLERRSGVVLPISAFVILLLMGTLVASTLSGVRTGIEDFFVVEAEGAIKSTTPGRPSLGTMVNFILLATAGLLGTLDIRNSGFKLSVFGWVIAIVGGIAIGGYVLDAPLLYYTVEGWSTAMAFHTAILFVLLGVGLIVLGTGHAKSRPITPTTSLESTGAPQHKGFSCS